MSEGDFSMKGLMTVVPTVGEPLRMLDSSNWVMGVCDLTFAESQFSVVLNQEWLAKYAERSKAEKGRGFFARRGSKVSDGYVNLFREKIGSGLSISYTEVQKVSGKEQNAPRIKKQEEDVGFRVKFEFNKGEHFWSGSYVEFYLTEGEYASITGYLTANPTLAALLDLQQD